MVHKVEIGFYRVYGNDEGMFRLLFILKYSLFLDTFLKV